MKQIFDGIRSKIKFGHIGAGNSQSGSQNQIAGGDINRQDTNIKIGGDGGNSVHGGGGGGGGIFEGGAGGSGVGAGGGGAAGPSGGRGGDGGEINEDGYPGKFPGGGGGAPGPGGNSGGDGAGGLVLVKSYGHDETVVPCPNWLGGTDEIEVSGSCLFRPDNDYSLIQRVLSGFSSSEAKQTALERPDSPIKIEFDERCICGMWVNVQAFANAADVASNTPGATHRF